MTRRPQLAWIKAGFQVVNYSGDIWLLGGALKSGLDALGRARRPRR